MRIGHVSIKGLERINDSSFASRWRNNLLPHVKGKPERRSLFANVANVFPSFLFSHQSKKKTHLK